MPSAPTKTAVNKSTSTRKPNQPTNRPEPVAKTEKKEDKKNDKSLDNKTSSGPLKRIPPLVLTKPLEDQQDRGWSIDNTASLSVTMNRIDDVFKPISPRNNSEKAMLEMICYVRSLREYTDEEIAHSLPPSGLCSYLDELYSYVDPAAVRIAFNRGIDVLLKDYTQRDTRVEKYVKR